MKRKAEQSGFAAGSHATRDVQEGGASYSSVLNDSDGTCLFYGEESTRVVVRLFEPKRASETRSDLRERDLSLRLGGWVPGIVA
jgi:hypothetical protein